MAIPSTWRTLATFDESNNTVAGVPTSHLLGPLLVGVLLNCFVYGIVFLHWIQYTLGRNKDSLQLRCVHPLFFRLPLPSPLCCRHLSGWSWAGC